RSTRGALTRPARAPRSLSVTEEERRRLLDGVRGLQAGRRSDALRDPRGGRAGLEGTALRRAPARRADLRHPLRGGLVPQPAAATGRPRGRGGGARLAV